MDLKAAAELLASIESRFDVTTLRHRGVRAWPIVRFAIFDQLWQRANPPAAAAAADPATPAERVDHVWRRARRSLDAALARRHERRVLADDRPVDVLLHSRAEDHTDRFVRWPGRELAFDRILDPLIPLCRGRYRHLKIEPVTHRAPATRPRYAGTVFYDPFLHAPTTADDDPAQESLDLGDLPGVVAGLDPGLQFDLPALRGRIDAVLSLQPRYRRILQALRPRCVLLVCYYSYYSLALVKACRDLGITVVDVQHGHQGRYNAFTAWWTRVPADGYDLLPTHFWAWGDASREDIERELPDGARYPAVVVGGYPWAEHWRAGREIRLPAAARTYLQGLSSPRHVVLVSLQPLTELVPDLLYEAIARAPADWLWLFRLHPHTRARVPEVEAELRRRGLTNAEVQGATDAPLYPLLARADHHVTCWSTVAYEALAVGTPTTIVHPTGASAYADYIAQGLFAYADSAAALIAAAGGPRRAPVEPAPYIVTDPKVALAALDTLVNASAVGRAAAAGRALPA